MLRGRAQLLQTLLATRFGKDAHHGFGSRQPVADPPPIAEHQLQSVGAHHLADRAAAQLPWILPQLLSELRLDLGRQAEVLPFRIAGTNLVTHHLQLFAQRLASEGNRFTARQTGQHSVFLLNMMTNREPCALPRRSQSQSCMMSSPMYLKPARVSSLQPDAPNSFA
jgi:hypothetical protein